MLSGILTPTAGSAEVDGLVPHKNRVGNAKNIGVVFGQRSQLYWDLPLGDSFKLHEKMYEIPKAAYEANVKLFTDILDLGPFVSQPVRQLSLGQKMRANIAISLLHNPKIVYLDEPTIGLDIVAKAAIRDFIVEINKKRGTTFIVTTHDMSDIERMCGRLMLIDRGAMQYDGSLKSFKDTYGDSYSIAVTLFAPQSVSHGKLTAEIAGENKVVLYGDKKDLGIAEAVSFVVQNYAIEDISINEASVESILRKWYSGAPSSQPAL
jgi:ABC-2 type transport system ATP-binding protein